VVTDAKHIEVQKAAYAIGNVGGTQAQDFLRKMAMGHSEIEIAKAAVYGLSNMLEDNDISPLLQILNEAENVEVRKAALYQIGNSESDEAVDALATVARGSDNVELRKAAVYALGNIGSDAARKVLVEIVTTEAGK
jgi:HEAT repeat protein